MYVWVHCTCTLYMWAGRMGEMVWPLLLCIYLNINPFGNILQVKTLLLFLGCSEVTACTCSRIPGFVYSTTPVLHLVVGERREG